MPSLRIKPGVLVDPLTPALARIIAAYDSAARVVDRELTITCGREAHKAGAHPKGEALDVRTVTLPDDVTLDVYKYVRTYLGPSFTTLYESPKKPSASSVLLGIVTLNPDATAAHLHTQVKIGVTFPPED